MHGLCNSVYTSTIVHVCTYMNMYTCTLYMYTVYTLYIVHDVCPVSVITVSVSLPEEVQAGLSQLWEEQKFTDIEFIISGQRVPAHKAVLAAQSQYFECMLYGNMKEASMSEITLQDVPVTAFRKVLQYAYTATLNMDNVALQVLTMHVYAYV